MENRKSLVQKTRSSFDGQSPKKPIYNFKRSPIHGVSSVSFANAVYRIAILANDQFFLRIDFDCIILLDDFMTVVCFILIPINQLYGASQSSIRFFYIFMKLPFNCFYATDAVI